MRNNHISKKEFTLMRNSHIYEEISKEITWLDSFFTINDNLSKEQVEQLPEEQKNFFKDSFFKILKQAQNEWKGSKVLAEDLGEDREGWVRCSLCGTPNRYVYYIVNQITGIELNVGCECIKPFEDIIKTSGFSLSKVLRDAKATRRVIDLNREIPGISKLIGDWNNHLDEYPIIIPTFIEKDYNELGNSFTKLYDEFVHEKIDLRNAIEAFKNLLNIRDRLLALINKYVKENKDKKYIASREIERWIYSEGNRDTIKFLKDDGIIKLRTAHRIAEPSFMKKVANDFKRIFNKKGISIKKAIPERKGYLLKCSPCNDIDLFCKHNELLINYGDHIFVSNPESKIDVKEILRLCTIEGEYSYLQFMDKLAYMMRGNDKVVFEMDNRFNSVTIRDTFSNKYLELPLNEFANRYMDLVYGFNNQEVKEIDKWIDQNNGKWLKKEDYEEFIDNRYRDRDERKEFRSMRERYRY